MTGKIKGNDGIILIFAGQVLRKICDACRVLAAAKTVSHNGDMLKPAFVLAAVMAEIAAADTAAFLVDLYFLFNHDGPSFLGGSRDIILAAA